MSTEQFSKEQFEAALPVNKNTGKALWTSLGLDKGEYTYIMPIKNGSVKRVAIMIRSSVDISGFAAGTGQDSIRLWLVNSETFKPLGKKVDAYTTRVKGWEQRMNDKLHLLYAQGLKMHNCPKCNDGVMVERKGKYGTFYGCSNYPSCKHTMNALPVMQHAEIKQEPIQDNMDLLEEVLNEKPQTDFAPSKYQQDIFDFVEFGTGNAVVEAVAGSGKTTTILKALEYTPKNKQVAFVAFNKKIATELQKRAPSHVHVSTLHSLGFSNIRNIFGKIKVDNRKTYWIIKDSLPDDFENIAAVIRLVSLLKATLLEPTNENLDYLTVNYNVNVNGDTMEVYQYTRIVFEKSISETWRIDFDDMIYFCVTGKAQCKKFDWLFVDECQDLNQAQIRMILNSIHSNSRVIAVGDRKQSIYGFRGADTQAMQNLIEALNAQLLPLSITYRCPKSHVALAQKLVPQIEAWKNAQEGTVETISNRDFLGKVHVNDLVLCRTNAPLVAPAFALIRNGIKAVILGRDIGKGLLDLIEKIQKKTKSSALSDLLYELQDYMYSEYSKLLAQNKESKAQALEDQVLTINALSDGCKTIQELETRIEDVFTDNAEGVTFSSVHKSKGGEAERVFILHPELMPHPLCMKSENPEALQQEMNIKYVALTRSKSELYFVR